MHAFEALGLRSPGRVFARVVRSPDPDELEVLVLQAADELARAGAISTDVELGASSATAFGLFCDGGSGEGRRLPAAEHLTLPPLTHRPVRLGGLLIGEGLSPSGGQLDLIVRTGGAFGTGLHPTTAMMLERLSRAPASGPVLDVGTGSGILALAALRHGAIRAVATDIDAVALDRARDNASANQLSSRMTVISELPPGSGGFELVLANIRGFVLRALCGHLKAHVAEGGRLLLSGLRFFEDASVEKAFSRHGLTVLHRLIYDGWWCVELGARVDRDRSASKFCGWD